MLGLTTMDADVIHNSSFDALARIGFRYNLELLGPDGRVLDVDAADNLYTTEGLNHMLGVELAGVTQIGTWYVGLFEGNYTPTAANVMATFSSLATECNAFSGPTLRKTYVPGSAASGTINNYASKAAFTFTAAKTIYGGFIASSSAVNATAGVLISVVRFSSPKVVDVGSVLNVGAGCTIVTA